jgi:hypothetical protein
MSAFAQRTDLIQYGANALGVFALQLRFGYETPDELADSITDGPDDHKCDIVHIDEDFGVAVIAQV